MNKEKKKERSRQYYIKNKEELLEYQRQYQIKNQEEIKIRRKKYRQKNKEKDRVYHKLWVKNNLEKLNKYNKLYSKQWREDNPEKVKGYTKNYNENNREKLREASRQRWKIKPEYCKKYFEQWREKNPEYYKKYYFIKRKTNLKYNLSNRMGIAINQSLKGNKAGRSWESLTGYNLADLKRRLNKTMPVGYTWEDVLSGALHIDHIIPIDAFNFTKPEHTDFKRCWALSNLRLLPAKENLIKSNHLIRPFQPALQI